MDLGAQVDDQLAAKRAAKLDQLAAADAERQKAADARRKEQEAALDPEENVKAVLATWKDRLKLVESDLAVFDKGQPAANPAQRRILHDQCDGIMLRLFDLERATSSAAYFMPAFEVRNMTDQVVRLRIELEAGKERRLPREAFRFSDQSVIMLVTDPMQQGLKSAADEVQPEAAPSTEDGASGPQDSSTMLSHMKGRKILLGPEELASADWTLSHLEDCTILLHGTLQALFLHEIKRCHIQAGPVRGATFGESVVDCTVMVATHQLRLHHVQNSSVYVRVHSNPIIEHCSGVRFAPLELLPYEGYWEELAGAGIGEASLGNWRKVLDFQHPNTEQSPNWSVLVETERAEALGTLEGSGRISI